MNIKPEKQQPARIIICNGKHCNADGSGMHLYEYLDSLLEQYDFFDPPFKVRTANCLDMCDDGPNMVIYPGNRRFSHLTIEKIDTILTEEVLSGSTAESAEG